MGWQGPRWHKADLARLARYNGGGREPPQMTLPVETFELCGKLGDGVRKAA
jgi:hypothetical protein